MKSKTPSLSPGKTSWGPHAKTELKQQRCHEHISLASPLHFYFEKCPKIKTRTVSYCEIFVAHRQLKYLNQSETSTNANPPYAYQTIERSSRLIEDCISPASADDGLIGNLRHKLNDNNNSGCKRAHPTCYDVNNRLTPILTTCAQLHKTSCTVYRGPEFQTAMRYRHCHVCS